MQCLVVVRVCLLDLVDLSSTQERELLYCSLMPPNIPAGISFISVVQNIEDTMLAIVL